ncbi:hypothetical protein GF359_05645 [candidate division WOR-3 bacterium]|uniref:Uncharacterized protein n=1 Tax=candidate division WOR-3 bacterium TaxID=2052148 RepID=A0A9D5QE41_UNCW3|nr:hypothetical protein [candidate division WOR-3 bacterium]MBD3364680.1 hypothetical protein [candidate division WOR-3 bacterium]
MFNKESISWLSLSYGDSTDVYGFPNGGLGMHIQVTDRKFPFAVQLSAEFPSLISLGLILGVKPRNLDREIISFGAKSLAYYPGSVYLNVHPSERIHLTVGASTVIFGGEVHAGIGYTFGRLKKRVEY